MKNISISDERGYYDFLIDVEHPEVFEPKIRRSWIGNWWELMTPHEYGTLLHDWHDDETDLDVLIWKSFD